MDKNLRERKIKAAMKDRIYVNQAIHESNFIQGL